jgi:hypothetical protein
MGGDEAVSAITCLVDLLAGKRGPEGLSVEDWDGVISVARSEALLSTLAHQLSSASLPPSVEMLFADLRAASDLARQQALWEAEMARRALTPLGIDFLLLKGTAYAAADLPCSAGRQIGDLDIMVAVQDLARAENALLTAGWEWVKPDPYDDAYYRNHMHELPPLIHKDRNRMIDVHHTILPVTHRITPDALQMMIDAIILDRGLRILSPPDMVCHCAAHMMADGDLQGGLRNLWDFHCLTRDFATADDGFWDQLDDRAQMHGLNAAVKRATRLSHDLYGTRIPPFWDKRRGSDRWFRQRLLARDNWGRPTRWMVQQGFYIRSHWLRMPPLMLAKHLWTKSRRP